ncbi:hypothetical protein [Pedobacter montanisoli]|uniref:Circularly permuted type 2 ATP-grasp protein n=1 Tax=Pedobacter montanisoli TaxID=2923277 RepID=A0ABS9ZTM0_9SPHI|nr:hypothetical protein [Pedobacter montanisoli]MCJ0741949.1 hypothetical protein [Pedobacter montanisoli]
MIKELRQEFNRNFSEEKYQNFLSSLNVGYPKIPFRVAETPVFIPDELKQKLIKAGDDILNFIKQPNFKELTDKAIPAKWFVPNENAHPHFVVMDFGIHQNQNGELLPMLIEMQGFPSLFGFQTLLAEKYVSSYQLNPLLTSYFGNFDTHSYFNLLKKVIVGDEDPSQVALMDIDAPHQKTAIDFYITAQKLGIKILSITDIKKRGRSLFYIEEGKEIQLKRIYNRLIFDEVADNLSVFKEGFDPREELDIKWITHPNWFYRISKYTMPFLKSPFIPETSFLDKVSFLPADLENYVLKPLFSFAGSGVIIDVTQQDIKNIKNPENWILQRKVNYSPVVEAPNGGVKVEIRLMYIWPDHEEPQLCINLARLSKGKMIGVSHNKDFDWVGGTTGLFL